MRITEFPMTDDALDEQLAADDADAVEDAGEAGYVPDPQTVWGAEAARAILVVLTRRFGAGFAREVCDEFASRTLSYQAGCPDDRRDGAVMDALLRDRFWDGLFAINTGEPTPRDADPAGSAGHAGS